MQWVSKDTGTVESALQFQVDATDPDATLRLSYTLPRTGESLNYLIRLQTTTPHLGGLRWWFTCPLVVDGEPCDRRVQKLYLPYGGKYYGCRHCYQLGYASNQGAKYRACEKTQRIRRRLGGSPSLYEPFPEKPRGMWWRTYHKLQLQAERAEHRYWAL